jgi:hypothetical protein
MSHIFDVTKRHLILSFEAICSDDDHCAFLCPYLRTPSNKCKWFGQREVDAMGPKRAHECKSAEEKNKQCVSLLLG